MTSTPDATPPATPAPASPAGHAGLLAPHLSISAFFPAYNDGGTIGSMVLTTMLTLEKITGDFEIIVVENGSSDNTYAVVRELADKYPGRIKALHYDRPLGYGGALRTGFKAATKEWVFYTDADAQYDPAELALLVPHAVDGVGLVNGWKIERNDPLYRIIIGRIYQYGIKAFFHLRLKDVDCDFRLIRRSVLEQIELKTNTGAICVELMRRIQSTDVGMVEVPVHHYHRTYGKSQFFNFRRIASTLLTLSRLWWELMPPRAVRKTARRFSSQPSP